MNNIPDKLIYIARNSIQVGIGIEWSKYNYKGAKLTVVPTFVVNPDKPKLVERGEKWAAWNYGFKEIKSEKIEKLNTPIKNLRLLHLDKDRKAVEHIKF